jgi:hypothetical protein
MANVWTADQVKEYMERLLDEQKQRVDLALSSADKAISKAEEATEKRLTLLNEFRGQQADEAKKYVPRETYDTSLDRISVLERFQWKLAGGIAFGLIIVPIITGIVVYALTRHAIPSTP